MQAKRFESVAGLGPADGPTRSAKSVLRCGEWVELFPVSSMKHRSDNCCSGWVLGYSAACAFRIGAVSIA
jgi:hypothetical protein